MNCESLYVQVEGSVKGETFQFEGKGFFEFLT